MVEVKVFERNYDGNRGKLLQTHKYPTQQEAQRALKALKSMYRAKWILAPIDNEVVKAREAKNETKVEISNTWKCTFTPVDKDKPLMHINLPHISTKDVENKQICKNLLAPLYKWECVEEKKQIKKQIPRIKVTRSKNCIVTM